VIKEEKKGLGPGGKPAVRSLKALGREYKRVQGVERSGKNARVVHGLDHRDREPQVIRRDVRERGTRLAGRDNEGTGKGSSKIIQPVVPEAGGKSRLEGRKWPALFSYPGNKQRVRESEGSPEKVGYVRLSRYIKVDEFFRQSVSVNGIVEAKRGEPIKPFLLITTKGTKRNAVSMSPRFQLGKERRKVSALDARLSGNITKKACKL